MILGKDCIITKAEVFENTGIPGEGLSYEKQLIVSCGEKAINILAIKPSGKQEMTVKAFLSGYGKHLKG